MRDARVIERRQFSSETLPGTGGRGAFGDPPTVVASGALQ